jgi:hypothetical protein
MTNRELKEFVNNNKENFAIQLKRHHLDLYQEIENLNGDYISFAEKLYVYLNGVESISKCKTCGNKVKFDGFWKGYKRTYCSYACKNKDKSEQSNEIRNCVICGKPFKIYKKRIKTTCSKVCLIKLGSTIEVNKKRQNSLKQTLLKNME